MSVGERDIACSGGRGVTTGQELRPEMSTVGVGLCEGAQISAASSQDLHEKRQNCTLSTFWAVRPPMVKIRWGQLGLSSETLIKSAKCYWAKLVKGKKVPHSDHRLSDIASIRVFLVAFWTGWVKSSPSETSKVLRCGFE